jgi:hypothetical protein
MCFAIDAAYEVDEVKDIRDRAVALEHYCRQAKNTQAERRACEIRLRAERKAGELLAEAQKNKGGRPKTGAPREPVLGDLGITKKQSSTWQRLGAIAQNDFERALATVQRLSTNGIIRFCETDDDDPQVSPTQSNAPVTASATQVDGQIGGEPTDDHDEVLDRPGEDEDEGIMSDADKYAVLAEFAALTIKMFRNSDLNVTASSPTKMEEWKSAMDDAAAVMGETP